MRLAMLLSLALVLSACGIVDSDPSDGVLVTGVMIESIPAARPDGSPWDEGSPPDVYLEIQDALGQVYLSGETMDAASLPTAAAANRTPRLDIDRAYFVYAVEQDAGTPSQTWPLLGATGSFSLSDVAAEQPATLRLTDDESGFCIVLALTWE